VQIPVYDSPSNMKGWVKQADTILYTTDKVKNVQGGVFVKKGEAVNNFASVTMTVSKEAVSSTKLTLAFKNTSNSQCIYGDYFLLEKKITGIWYQVPVTIDANYGFNAIGYNLACGDASENIVD
jgi:hypothetical protein